MRKSKGGSDTGFAFGNRDTEQKVKVRSQAQTKGQDCKYVIGCHASKSQ